MFNSEHEEFLYTTKLLYNYFNVDSLKDKVYIIDVTPRYTGKWFSNTPNMLKRRYFIINALYYNIVAKNSYFFLTPYTKLEKCSIIEIVSLKELNYFSLRAWYPSTIYKPYNNLNFYTIKLYVERLNRLNNYIKEVSE